MRSLRSILATLLCAATLWLGAAASVQACTTGGCVSAGPRLASVSSSRGALLNALLGNLTGSTLTLGVTDWNALATGDVSVLKMLNALQAQLGVSSASTALASNASLAQVLAAAATAATGENKTLLAASLGTLQGQLGLAAGSIRLGDLLVTDGGVGDTRLNVLEFATGAMQLYNTRNVATTTTPILLSGSSIGLSGLLNQVQLAAQVVEPPVFVCGPVGSSFHTAAIRVKLNIDLVSLNLDTSLLTALLGISTATVQIGHLDLYVEVARANGIIAAVDAVLGAMSVQATPGVADLHLGLMSDNVFFNRSRAINPATDLAPAVIGSVKINSATVALMVKSSAFGQAPSASVLNFTGPYPQTLTAYTQAGFAANLVSSLVGNLQLSISPSLGLLDVVVLPVLKLLVQGALSPVLGSLLGGLADPLLELIGVRIGEVDVNAGGSFRVCSIGGSVYDDNNHSARREAGENGTGATLYAKLVAASAPAGPAVAVATVDPSSGAFSFAGVGVGSYTVVVSTSGAAAVVTPAGPAGWIATEVPTLARSVTLSTDLASQSFGLYRGSRISGMVFQDTGRGAGTANNGQRDGTELARVGAGLVLEGSGGVVIARVNSGDQGGFTLWIPAASAGTLNLRQTPDAQWVSVGGHAGTSGGTYSLPADSLTFTVAAGQSSTGVLFADVPANRFDTDGQQTALPGTVAFYAHSFVAGSAGLLTLGTTAPAVAGWSSTLHEDLNCNGRLDAGEAPITAARAVVAEQRLCVIAKVSVPAGAPYNSQYPLAVTARLVYANHTLAADHARNDLTTVGDAADAGLRLAKTVDKAVASIGDTLTYTINYVNQGNTPLTAMKIADSTPAYTVFVSAACGAPPSAALTCSVSQQPAASAAGTVEWSFTGPLASGTGGSVTLVVRLQ
jgi:uncharacterized repeat protein (TIGR01451 family)